MSDTGKSPQTLPNLQQQRKRAKDLLRAHRRRERQAAQRIICHLPRASALSWHQVGELPLSLSEMQLVVAREAGFDSWPRMKHRVEEAAGQASRLNLLIEAAVSGDIRRVQRLMQSDPALIKDSLAAAAAVGDDVSGLRLLKQSPQSALRACGPLGWTPILYACCSRFGRLEPQVGQSRIRLVRRLLELGADPNGSCAAPDLIDGRRSALAGAAAFTADPRLLEMLLQAGTKSDDGPALWAVAGQKGNEVRILDCLKVLLKRNPPTWQLHPALSLRLDEDDIDAARLLIEKGADPNTGGLWGRSGTLLHHAVWKGCRRAVLEILLKLGADPQCPDRDGRTAYRIAVRTGHREAVELLGEQAGAEVDGLDRLLAECVKAKPAKGLERLKKSKRKADVGKLRRSDHQMLCWAIRRGRIQAVEPLLDAGLDPKIPDDDGETALHIAASKGHLPVVKLLLKGGASAAARNHSGRTPLDLALALADLIRRRSIAQCLVKAGAPLEGLRNFPCGDEGLDRLLRLQGAVEINDREQAFENAADAIVSGDAKTLWTLLDEEPELIHARSKRPHRATLLHYLGANGIETERQQTPSNAVEIAGILLDRGAEADALCATYGGGPAQTTLSLLVSSTWPAQAGLQGDLAELLCTAGADPNGLDHDGVPLANAIAFRHPQAVPALIKAGAKLDNPIFAAAAGRLDLVQRDIAQDGRLRPQAGYCPLSWLHMSRDPEVAAQQTLLHAARFGHLEIVRWLADRGVDPTAAPVDGITALHEASLMGHPEVVNYLLDQGADAAAREKRWGGSAFGWANEGNQKEVLKLLSERAQPDIFDAVELNLARHVVRLLDDDPSLVHAPDGQGAPLRIAAAEGHLELVRLLLQRGADPKPAGLKGQTALDLARSHGDNEIVRLLEKEGRGEKRRKH